MARKPSVCWAPSWQYWGVLTPIAALTYPIAIVLPKLDTDAKNVAKLSALVALIVTSIAAAVLLTAGGWIAVAGQAIHALLLWTGIRSKEAALPGNDESTSTLRELANRHKDFPLYRAPRLL